MTKERRTPRGRATGSLRPYEQVVIEAVRPAIEAGRFPAKVLVGENFAVEASVFRHGHERLRAAFRWRAPHETTFHEAPITLFNPGLDLWRAEIPLERVDRHHYRVVEGAIRTELRQLPQVRLILDPAGKAAKGEAVDLARGAEGGRPTAHR